MMLAGSEFVMLWHSSETLRGYASIHRSGPSMTYPTSKPNTKMILRPLPEEQRMVFDAIVQQLGEHDLPGRPDISLIASKLNISEQRVLVELGKGLLLLSANRSSQKNST